MVDVSSQNNSVSINVSSGGNSASIKATPDMAQFYSEKSREWAISNRIVDNTDYSSKYYAEKSKESEAKAENYERSIIEKYNSFVEVSNQAEAELQTLKDDSISQINTVASSGISDIANKTSEAVTNLNTNIETATSEINNVKNNAVTQLSKEAQEQLKNIESTGFYMRDDKLYFINSKGEEEEFKSGGGGAGAVMFDTKIADHILEGEEALGWALQGTYVAKEVYPDFYNKCLEEYKNSKKAWTKSNVSLIGSVVDNQGVLSEFGLKDYAQLNKDFDFGSNPWEFVLSITTGSVVSGMAYAQFIYSGVYSTTVRTMYVCIKPNGTFGLATANGGKDWNVMQGGTHLVQPNTDYLLKISYSGTNYKLEYSLDDGKTFIDDVNVASSHITASHTPYFGSYVGSTNDYSFLGSVNLKETYINVNGQRYWTGADTTNIYSNGHKFYPISEKSAIDAIYNQYGIADFYGIDEVNERIFLPRNKYFAVTGGVAGNGMTLGLTNGTNNFALNTFNNQNVNAPIGAYALYGSSVGSAQTNAQNTVNTAIGVTSDPTKSGIILQPNENKYLYYCVGNTEVTQAITNVVEVTTSENDTIPLFTGMYFDFKPNNASWLKAGQQQNNAGIYKTCYDTLVEIVNGVNKYDLKVINEADMLADVDYDEYWVLYQDNLKFRTPLTISLKTYDTVAPVVGNGMSLGLTDGSQKFGLRNFALSSTYTTVTDGYGVPVGATTNTSATNVNKAVGVTSDPTKSGIEAHLVENTTAQLYFKVANAVQNLELLDAGEVLEGLADKANKTDVDGLPVFITLSLINGFTESMSQTFDLSDYLPKDNYCYEVFVTGYGNTGATSGHTLSLSVATSLHSALQVFACRTRSASSVVGAGTCSAYVGLDRKITISNSGHASTGTSFVRLQGYRRLGANV